LTLRLGQALVADVEKYRRSRGDDDQQDQPISIFFKHFQASEGKIP
jgi:hypothetical protein